MLFKNNVISFAKTPKNIINFAQKNKILAIQSDTAFQIQDSSSVESIISSDNFDNNSGLMDKDYQGVDSAYLHQTQQPQRFVTELQNHSGEINPMFIPENQSDWIMGILVGCLFVIAAIRFTGKKVFYKLSQFVVTSVSRKQPSKISEFMPAGYRITFFVLIPAIYSVLALIIIRKFSIHPFDYHENLPELYLKLVGIIFGFLILKTILIKISGFIFKDAEIAKEYNSSLFAFNAINSSLLVPILMLSLYDRSLTSIYLAILLCTLLFIFRIIRGINIALKGRKYSLFHFFIYFCTLEITPILIVLKTILIVNKL